MMILDIVVAVLLLATIVFSWKLGRSISAFRQSKKEMSNFINQFSVSIAHAEESIGKLKTLNKEIDGELRMNIERARFLANDLSFLIHKGNEVAVRMEGKVSSPQAVPSIKKTSLSTNDFVKRAEKITSGEVDAAYKSLPQKPADYPASKRLAMQEALRKISVASGKQASSVPTGGQPGPIEAQAPKALVKIMESQQANQTTGQLKEKRLFDSLKWGRQLETTGNK